MGPDRSGRWYDTSERIEWGWPEDRQTAAVPYETPPAGKKRSGMKAVMISLCVLILIAATAYAFSPGTGKSASDFSASEKPSGHDDRSDREDDHNPFGDYDDYDDFRAFFEDYYTSGDSYDGSTIPRAETGVGPSLALESSAGLDALSRQEIYARGIDSVVGIAATVDDYDGYYWGTGIILSEDGYILTNAHVISGTSAATVSTNDGTEYEASLVGEDSRSDLAVLKIEARGLRAAVFGVSDELSVGDEVIAIGNPLGDELSGTMTNGIVSAINRDVTVDGHRMALLQTNAAINEGNSGGPLFNCFGQVIGITNMKMVARYTQATIEGIGFAIPSSSAKEVIDRIIAGQPGIGITVGAIPEGAAEQYTLPDGLYISAVQENSDAYAKGIRPGDVITKVNGTAVTVTDELMDIKNGFSIGDTLTFTIFREGETFEIEVSLINMNDLY